MTKAEAEKLTWCDIKRIIKIWQRVAYEHRELPYDEIPWALPINGEYIETLRRFKEEAR